MKKFTKKHIIIYASITVALLVIIAVSFKSGNNVVSNALGTVFSPVQKVVAKAGNGIGNVVKNIANSGDNARENKALREENLSLKGELRMVEGYKAENDSLRAMLSLKETRTDFNSTAANIIGIDTDETSSVLTIDKGSKDGVFKNSVVLVPDGLVGVVFEVGYNYAKVRTIFDEESSVSAICLRSGDMGIVESSGFSPISGKCSLNYLDRSAKTVVGDVIETSGTGGIYPRGIVIGKITEIKEDSRNLTLSAVLETSINPGRLDSVLVTVK